MSSRGRRVGNGGARRVVVTSSGGGSSSSLSDRFSQIKPKTFQTSLNDRQNATANNRFSAVMARRTGQAPVSQPRPTRGGSAIRGAGRGARGARGGRGGIVRGAGGLRTSGSLQRGFRSGTARGGRTGAITGAVAGHTRGRGQRGGRGGRGRGRGGRGGSRAEPPSKDDLDKDLDSYMQSSRNFLDDDLDAYQAERTK